jgi:hypothetical protein
MMETVHTFLEYHAFEGGELSSEYARELLIDAINCGLICDAQSINQIDVERETRAANCRASIIAEGL